MRQTKRRFLSYERLKRDGIGQGGIIVNLSGLGSVGIKFFAVAFYLESKEMSDESISAFCNACMKYTRHRVLFSHAVGESDDYAQISWRTEYQTIQCQGCMHITFRTDSTHSDHYDEDGIAHTITCYPPPVSRKEPLWFKELPRDIQSVMSEVYIALHAGSHYLATLGARTVLDLLITKKIGDAGTFKEKIAKLTKDGHITSAESDLIEAVIEAGSASAHRGYFPDLTSLKHVMDILEAVLDKFYAAEGRQKRLAAQAAALKKKIPPRKP